MTQADIDALAANLRLAVRRLLVPAAAVGFGAAIGSSVGGPAGAAILALAAAAAAYVVRSREDAEVAAKGEEVIARCNAWLAANPDEIGRHAGRHAAVHPERGIVVSREDKAALMREIALRGMNGEVAITWIGEKPQPPPMVVDGSAEDLAAAMKWIEANGDALKGLAGRWVAVSPTRGVVGQGSTSEEAITAAWKDGGALEALVSMEVPEESPPEPFGIPFGYDQHAAFSAWIGANRESLAAYAGLWIIWRAGAVLDSTADEKSLEALLAKHRLEGPWTFYWPVPPWAAAAAMPPKGDA